MEWCREKVICLIRLFEERPCLWDKTHKFYRDRDEKNAAMLEISEQLGLSCIEVERKLNTLLTQYRREKHVQRKMESAGCLVKKPWFGYNLLKFLEPVESKYFNKWPINVRSVDNVDTTSMEKLENISNNDVEAIHRVLFNNEGINSIVHQPRPPSSQNEYDTVQNAAEPEVVVEQASPTDSFPRPIPVQEHTPRKRKHASIDRTKAQINQAYRILKASYKQSQQRDDLKIFAEGVETRLRNIKDKRRVCILKHQIETLLFTAEMEELAQTSMAQGLLDATMTSMAAYKANNISPNLDDSSKPS